MKTIFKTFLVSSLIFCGTIANAQNNSAPAAATAPKTMVTENIPYVLNEQKFFSNSVSVLIPSTFMNADQNFIAEKYPDPSNYPKIVMTDNTKRPMLALNITPNVGDRQDIIHFMRDTKNDLMRAYPTARFINSDVVRNRSLAIIEVIIPNKEGKNLYNMMAFRYIGKDFFFLNFSCPQEDIGKWQDSARDIANNVKLATVN